MNKHYWIIISGKIILPFTMRTTKKQCLADRNKKSIFGIGFKDDKCIKVKVKIV